MALDTTKKHKKDEIQKDRRSFLKKSVYSTPKLIALGYLLSSSQAAAECDPFTNEGCNGVSGPIGFYDRKILKKLKNEESEIV